MKGVSKLPSFAPKIALGESDLLKHTWHQGGMNWNYPKQPHVHRKTPNKEHPQKKNFLRFPCLGVHFLTSNWVTPTRSQDHLPTHLRRVRTRCIVGRTECGRTLGSNPDRTSPLLDLNGLSSLSLSLCEMEREIKSNPRDGWEDQWDIPREGLGTGPCVWLRAQSILSVWDPWFG